MEATESQYDACACVYSLISHRNSLRHIGMHYDHDANRWVKVDATFVEGVAHAAQRLAEIIGWTPEQFDLAQLDVEQHDQQQAEMRAEQRNEQALYGPW